MKNLTKNELGKQFHIKNGYAKRVDDLWFNDCTLIDVEEEWSQPSMFTFKNEIKGEFIIDGDFLKSCNRENRNERIYTFIAN